MKILLAADGSKFTKKALAYLVANENLAGENDEVIVLHVQPTMPPRVRAMLGADAVHAHQTEEAQRVLQPIERFLKRHPLNFRTQWQIGDPATEIVRIARRQKAQLIVMGTHGRGPVGRALMGSVAQRVITDSPAPVLLVK